MSFKRIPSRLFSAIACLSFLLSITAWVDDRIDEYNRNVRWEEHNREIDANHGPHFAVDAGPDYRPLYRTWIVLLSGLGFSLTLRRKSLFFSIIPYLVMTPLV